MKILISGGCKNGKSTYGEKLAVSLAGGGPLYYVATMLPVDEEDHLRIMGHRESRKHLGFETVEMGRDIIRIMKQCNPAGTFLVDALTALLANEMFPPGGGYKPEAAKKAAAQLVKVTRFVSNIIIVSDYIYSDAAFYSEETTRFMEELARADRSLAAVCDAVLEVCGGSVMVHKGSREWGGIL